MIRSGVTSFTVVSRGSNGFEAGIVDAGWIVVGEGPVIGMSATRPGGRELQNPASARAEFVVNGIHCVMLPLREDDRNGEERPVTEPQRWEFRLPSDLGRDMLLEGERDRSS